MGKKYLLALRAIVCEEEKLVPDKMHDTRFNVVEQKTLQIKRSVQILESCKLSRPPSDAVEANQNAKKTQNLQK